MKPGLYPILFGGLVPSLSLNFLTEAVDGRITYSGGAGGTRVNSAGSIVAATTPRIDYDPVTLACKGLLIEEQRTNVALQSGDFSNANWTASALNLGTPVGGQASPDGGTAGVKLVETNATGAHRARQADITIVANSTWTISVFVKAAERTRVSLRLSNTAFTNYVEGFFNLSAGTVVAANNGGLGTGATGTIQAFPNGWYRCILSGAINNADTTARVTYELNDASGAASYTGVTGSGAIFWGAQQEAGAFATSYVPTGAAQVTRTADSAVMTGTNFSSWYNQPNGTFYVEADLAFPASGGNQFLARASDNSFNNQIAVNVISTGFLQIATASGGVLDGAATAASGISAGVVFKTASAYASNDLALSLNGATPVGDSTATIPTALTRLDIGADHNGTNHVGSGHIRVLKYFQPRTPNPKLQSMST